MVLNCLTCLYCEVLLLAAVFAGILAASPFAMSSSESLSIVNRVEDINLSIQPAIEYMEFHALPVGQGDCTMIRCPGPNEHVVIVDCGSSGGRRLSSQQVENYLRPYFDQVVAIFITHPDRDHFNYLPHINWNIASIDAVIIGGTLQDYNRPGSPDLFKSTTGCCNSIHGGNCTQSTMDNHVSEMIVHLLMLASIQTLYSTSWLQMLEIPRIRRALF